MGTMLKFLEDFTKYRRWMKDFDDYTAAEWTVTKTEAGAGSASVAVGNTDGGILLVTNDAADDDNVFHQWIKEAWKWETSKDLYIGGRFKVSEALQCDVIMGILITDTTPLDASDGFFIQKDDGDGNIDFVVVKNGTRSTLVGGTLAADTYVSWGMYYDAGTSRIKCYLDGSQVGSLPLTNVCDDEELTLSFGLQNGEAVIKTMSVDYLLVAKER